MNGASLTIEKPWGLAVQEVRILDSEFHPRGQATLTESRSEAEFPLEPGRYLLIGSSPSISKREEIVSLSADETKRVVIGSSTPSPHEWLGDLSSRGMVPQAQVFSTEHFPSGDLNEFKKHRGPTSLELPIGDRLNAQVTGQRNGEAFIGPNAGETASFEIRSYVWSPKRGQTNRSSLLDTVYGRHADDFTLLSLPPRPALVEDMQSQLHYLKIQHEGGGELDIAVPLFSGGSSLVLAMPKAEAAKRGQQVGWQISSSDSMLDTLLQMLASEPVNDVEPMIERSIALTNLPFDVEEAVIAADPILRNKLYDPYAATVAALVMLKYRRLERRANWIENLANWFPWLPDAQLLSAWANLMLPDGDNLLVVKRLVALYDAGPPVFTPARKLARDLTVLLLDEPDEVTANDRYKLKKLSERLSREMRLEVADSPIYVSFRPE